LAKQAQFMALIPLPPADSGQVFQKDASGLFSQRTGLIIKAAASRACEGDLSRYRQPIFLPLG